MVCCTCLFQSRGGSALIMLVKAMQTVMEKAPIDAVTGAARATLAYDQLLLTQTDNDQSIVRPLRYDVQVVHSFLSVII